MSRELVSKRTRFTLAVLLLCSGLLASRGTAGNAVTVQLHGEPSNPIYVDAGTVTINFSALLVYSGIREPWNGEAANVLVYKTSGESLATLPIPNAVDIWAGHGGSGVVTWNNPIGQYIQVSGLIYFDGDGGHSPFYWFYLPEGKSVASGGDTAPSGGNGVTTQNPTTPSSPPVAPVVGSRIHAVIISGLSDPAKVISSPNVTLTGGIVALGKTGTSAVLSSSWSPGERILPDYDLLTGVKIPPVTPNIIDVRIVRQQVIAEFPSELQHIGN